MKKLLIGTLLTSSLTFADVTTILPYAGHLSYDNSQAKSLKDSANFGGFYASKGNLSYLLEFAYNYMNIDYKSSTIENLKQHDFTVVHSKYNTKYMTKLGFHYIDNNEKELDRDLGDGYTIITGVAGYNWLNSDKFTYGTDLYYTKYNNAHDDTTLANTTSISLLQISPYISYSHLISLTTRNDFGLKANMIVANDYKDDRYYSLEVTDTFAYKKFYATASYLFGEMKSGVRDNGFTVFNTKDLYKNSFKTKVGYYFTPRLSLNLDYTVSRYKEYDAATLQLLPEGTSTTTNISLSYSF